MINGGHVILYSSDADADRAFLRDVLRLPHVDAGEGWLIFALPPSEVAVHPSTQSSHEFYLMCSDIESLVNDLVGRGVACSPVANRGWGLLSEIRLPSGARLGVYQPRHARPTWKSSAAKPRKPARRKAGRRKRAQARA